jgi:hypothetical protein
MSSNRARSLVLHIGDPKTGTSSIQRALQLGLVEGKSAKVSGFINHINSANAISFARSFTPAGEGHKEVGQVDRWIKKESSDVLIISSEFFSLSEPELVKRSLDEKYPDLSGKIKVIAYVRPHVCRALSAFTERTKAGYTLSDFDKWLGHFLKSGALYYTPRFQKWRAAFGENFVLRPYIRAHIREQDVVTDFFSEALGAGNFSLGRRMSENQKISIKALSGLSGFNRGMSEAGIISKQRIPMSLMISRFIKASPGASAPKMGADHITRIIRACRQDAHDLDQEFFGEPLFMQELRKARKDSLEGALDLSIERHYTPAEQAMLNSAVADLTALMSRRYKKWAAYYRTFSTAHNAGKPIPAAEDSGIQKHLQDLAGLFS